MTFDIGTAVNRTFGPAFRNPLTFFGIAALLVALSFALSFAVTGGALLAAGVGTGLTAGFGVGVLVALLVGIAVNAIAQGALIHAALEAYRGRPVSIPAALRGALPHFLPLVAINILLALGIGLGFVLLIIPGLFLLVKWSASVPARVSEGRGIIESFKRSWSLTEGAWWPIFGFIVLLAIGSLILSLVVSLPLSTLAATNPAGAGFGVSAVVAQLIVSTVQTVFGATAIAAIYYGLRQAKEGGDTAALEETFA